MTVIPTDLSADARTQLLRAGVEESHSSKVNCVWWMEGDLSTRHCSLKMTMALDCPCDVY